jgi:hypothetical protein
MYWFASSYLGWSLGYTFLLAQMIMVFSSLMYLAMTSGIWISLSLPFVCAKIILYSSVMGDWDGMSKYS